MTEEQDARKLYADIIDLPRPVNKRRKHIPPAERAAQFAPFAALSGYDEMVQEEARLTEGKTDLSEYELEELNRTLQALLERLRDGEHPFVSVSYFLPDSRKAGGSYRTVSGRVREIDPAGQRLLLFGSERIEDRRVPPIETPFRELLVLNEEAAPFSTAE